MNDLGPCGPGGTLPTVVQRFAISPSKMTIQGQQELEMVMPADGMEKVPADGKMVGIDLLELEVDFLGEMVVVRRHQDHCCQRRLLPNLRATTCPETFESSLACSLG